MRGGRRLGWRLLIAAVIVVGLWAIATDPALDDGHARPTWALMLGIGTLAGIPAIVILKALVREVPLGALVAAVFVGMGPVTACVLALGPLYQLQWTVDLPVLLLHRGTLPPLVEETAKAAGIVAVLLALGASTLTRRHGKAVGAAVGLGFTISELATYAAVASTGDSILGSWGQLVMRMGLLGLTGHALTAALAGVGVADALGAGGVGPVRRARLLAPWLALAILTHALMNTLGAGVQAVVIEAVAPWFEHSPSFRLPLQAVWLGMVVSTVVAQLWAVLVLWRWGRASRASGPAPSGPADGAPESRPAATPPES